MSERHDAQIALMKFLSTVARRAGADEHVYVVGGAVRDFVMGRPIKDVDVVVDAVSLGRNRDSAWFAEQVVRSIPVASSYVTNQYGVAIITVKGPWVLDGQDLQGEVIEIANARKESYGAGDDAGKGYKPTDVQLATIHEDVERREFTFNCMAGDTLIPTEQGILRIDQISSREDGDHQDINLTVAGQAGPSTAVGWQYSGYAPTLRVTTEWGHSFACTHHHPVLVLRGHDHEWVQADQLEEGDLLCVPPKQVTRQKPLVLALPDPMQPKRGRLKDVIKPERMTPELAFLIGCVVAEGSNTHKRVSFSNSDPNLISRYVECFHATFGFQPSRNKVVEKGSTRILGGVAFFANNDGYDIYADSRAVVGWLEDLGLYCGGSKDGKSASHHKVVPWSILQADERSQWAFLAAYLEGDGSIRPDTGRITYCSASPHVRQQLQVLLGAHGILSKVEDRFVYINAVDSAFLWEKIQPWMVTKEFDYTHRNNKSRNRYGIPKEYLQGVLLGRRIRVGNNQGPSIYRTDDGGETSQGGVLETLRLPKRILHDAYARGDFDGFMVSLKVISPDEHAKLKRLFDLGYQYVEVTSVEDAGEQDVFDISMGEGVEPAFVANGVVVHNTLLWRLRDLATGPEKAEVIDLMKCGLRDLEQGVVRCPRDPDIVFSDDPTRMIRLIKFVGRYGFKVPPDVAASVRLNAGRIAQAPWEAIASLLVHDIIEKPYARRVLPMMKDLGLLDAIAGMVASTPPFRSYLERELRGKPAHLVADLLEHGLTDPTPVKALTPDQRARFVDVVRGLSAIDAELLSSALQRPPVDNNALIAEFALRAEQRGRIAPLAREALLADPALTSDPAALTDAVRDLLRSGRTAGELIPGGKARDLSPSAFDPDELARGVTVELEHTPDPAVAREIAMDHLSEFPDYYTRLDRMESEARAKTAAAPKKYDHIDFKPPKGVAAAAEKGLELRQKASPSNRGGFTPAQAAEEGIGSGVQRAVNLKNRDTVSPDVIKQMTGFFSRHEKNKDVPADKKAEPWNAKGYVAWLLWGGDPGRSWAEKVRDQMEAADDKEKPSKKASLDEAWGDILPRVASRPVQARTYNRIVMYDFDGTLFRSWEKTPDWWPDPTPYSFFSKPESLDEPCVPEHPGSNYWISKAVQAAQEDTHDRNTYSVLITGRVRVHAERVAELLAQKGIRFNRMVFNPGMSAAKFKTIALGQLLAGHNTVNEVAIWENENQSHYAQYLSVASAALGRSDINVVVHNIHEKAIPLACGPEDFGVEARTASMFHGRDVTTPEQVKAEFDHNLALFRRDFDDAMRTMTRYGDTPEVWAAGRAAVPATAAFLAFLAGRTLTSLAAQIKLVPSQHRRLFETARREFARTRKFDYPTWFGKNIAMLRMMYDVGSWPDVPAATPGAEGDTAGAVTLIGSIRIVNQTDQDPDKSVDIVRRAVRALSDSGVPSITRVLYGDVFIVGEVARKKSLAAWYYKDRDIIEVLSVRRFAEQSVRVTIHELGHRYWMKFMAGDAKRAWSRHHTDMSYASSDPVFPQVGDVLDYVQGKPTVSSISQGIINFEGGGFVLKGNLVGFLRDRARQLTFPTPYAVTNEEEHFCESLSLFCLGDLKGSNLAAFKVIVLGETAEQSELSLVASWGHGPHTHR